MGRRIKGSRPRGRHFIREWREHRDYSQEILAELMGTTKGTISRVENRETNYTQDFLELCAEVLRTTPAALISEPPSPHGEPRDVLAGLTEGQRRQALAILQAFADASRADQSPPEVPADDLPASRRAGGR